MDPLSHAALGRSLVALRSNRLVRGSVAAAVLGALSPDLDAAVMPFGWDRYLRVHEIGTHTVVGTCACAVLVGAVVRLFVKGSAFGALTIASWLGAGSHVLLDLVSSARLRPLWPLSDIVVSLPAVAMADPYLLVLCAAGPVAIWMSRGRADRAARGVLTLVVLFLLMKAVLGVRAFSWYRSARNAAGAPVVARMIEAKWASLTEWHVFDRTPAAVRQWRVAAGGETTLLLQRPIGTGEPLVERSRSLSTVRNFLHVHELAFASTRPASGGGGLVLWSDIRFCSPDGDQIACALWFGGELDAAGNVVQELVKLGRFTQTRPPSR